MRADYFYTARKRRRVITFRVYRSIGLINRALNVPRENRYVGDVCVLAYNHRRAMKARQIRRVFVRLIKLNHTINQIVYRQ